MSSGIASNSLLGVNAIFSVNKTFLNTNSTYAWTVPIAGGFKSKHKKIALAQFQMYNAIPNVATAFQNTSFSYTVTGCGSANGTFVVPLIPQGTTTGVYVSISDINAIFQAVMTSNGHFLLDTNKLPFFFLSLNSINYADRFNLSYTPIPATPDLTTSASPYNGYTFPVSTATTRFTSANFPQGTTEGTLMQFQLLASQPGLATTLGFPVGTYPSSASIATPALGSITAFQLPAPNIPQIAVTTSLLLQTNFVRSSPFGNTSNTIATIPINAGPNGTITYQTGYPLFIDIVDGTYPSFTVTLCQQDGTPLFQNLEAVSIVMTFIISASDTPPDPAALFYPPQADDGMKRIKMGY